jgi:AhpC/TSA family
MTSLVCSSLLALAIGSGLSGLVDLEGHPITQLSSAGTRVVVLFFAASDCPISNRYVPEVQRLATQFASRGVRTWFVYPNPGDTVRVVRAHNQAFAIVGNTVLDTRQTLMDMAHATITPEAAVFVADAGGLREVYRGRIDDRYLALGTERPQATHHDLEEAIRAVLAQKPVSQPGGPTIGCSIVTLHP